MEQFAAERGIVGAEGWRGVTYKDISEAQGRGLLAHYRNSVRLAVEDCFPEIDIGDKRVVRGHWDGKKNRRAFLESIAPSLGVKTVADWQDVTIKDVKDRGGAGVLSKYNHSLRAAILDLYPGAQSLQWRAKQPTGHWLCPKNRRRFLDGLSRAHGVNSDEDWQTVSIDDVRDAGGGGFLRFYNNSLRAALADVYKEDGLRKSAVRQHYPRNHWESKENRRKFLDDLAEKMGATDAMGWKNVTHKDVLAHGGAGLMDRFAGSLYWLLRDAYGLGAWEAFEKRHQTPKGFWETEENVRSFLEHVRGTFGVEKLDDWFRISYDQLRATKGGNSFVKHMDLVSALKMIYTGEPWDEYLDERGNSNVQRRAAQRFLFLRVKDIFSAVS